MILECKNIKYKYQLEEPYILKGISCTINENDIVAVIGSTGSGKSTFLQCIANLLPYEGEVICDKEIRMVFQYPEYQLFESSVLKDVMFGALNKNMTKDEAEKIAKESLIKVGINENKFDESPFDLSGGEKRRVAIAGILAMKPDILLLDEPGAGLDPIGREEIFGLLKKLNENGTTIIFVSHSMDDVVKYANKIIVINNGELLSQGSIKDVFEDDELIKKIGLGFPEGNFILKQLKKKGFQVDTSLYDFNDIKKCLETLL